LMNAALGSRARGLLLVLVVVAFPAMVGFGDSAESRNRRANRYYRDGKYDEALAEYRGAQVHKPELRELAFNAGDALYRKGELPNALREFEQASAASDSLLAAAAYYNAGNAFMNMGDLESAIESYRSSLILNPSDGDTKFNLELALSLLEQQQQQQQQEQQGQQGEQQQEGQDQQQQGEQEQDEEKQNDQGQQGDQEQDEQEQDEQEQQGDQERDEQNQDQQRDDQQQLGQEGPQDGQSSQEETEAMSLEEAERLLDALEESEKELQAEIRSAASKSRKKVDKDW